MFIYIYIYTYIYINMYLHRSVSRKDARSSLSSGRRPMSTLKSNPSIASSCRCGLVQHVIQEVRFWSACNPSGVVLVSTSAKGCVFRQRVRPISTLKSNQSIASSYRCHRVFTIFYIAGPLRKVSTHVCYDLYDAEFTEVVCHPAGNDYRTPQKMTLKTNA